MPIGTAQGAAEDLTGKYCRFYIFLTFAAASFILISSQTTPPNELVPFFMPLL